MGTINLTGSQVRWLFANLNRPHVPRRKLREEHDRWRKIAELQHLSRAARGRLEWIILESSSNPGVMRLELAPGTVGTIAERLLPVRCSAPWS